MLRQQVMRGDIMAQPADHAVDLAETESGWALEQLAPMHALAIAPSLQTLQTPY